MAQAHLSSLDMSSVDKEEPSSGDEEEEHETESQQTISATGGSDSTVFHILYLHMYPTTHRHILHFENSLSCQI